MLNLPLRLVNIPEKKENQLKRKGFATYGDLMRFYPRKYEDRSNVVQFADLSDHIGEKVSLIGAIKLIRANYEKKYVQYFLCNPDPSCRDHGVNLYFFHQMFMQNKYREGDVICVHGKLDGHEGFYRMAPEYHSPDLSEIGHPFPVYSKINGMSADYLRHCILETHRLVVESARIEPIEDLDPAILKAFHLDDTIEYLRKVHFPRDMGEVTSAQCRRDVETLLPVVRGLIERERETAKATTKIVVSHQLADALRARLPYELTADQADAVKYMRDTMSSGKRMDVLLQADVGAGKTICAALAVAEVLASGYQAVIMAPTSVLAEQHFNEFSGYFPGQTALLSSKMKAKERRALLKKIKDGSVGVIVGTHSAISADVEYHNLALTVVDEEHKFGVEQRDLLRHKAAEGAHSLSMSATPIPRSLALAIYGSGTTVIDIHTMPAGRKPVQTFIRQDERVAFRALQRQIGAGHQAYIVCPLIEAGEGTAEGVDSIEDTYEHLESFFKDTGVRIACIHGNMKPAQIEAEIRSFSAGERDILLSTTIVEVGVNVPNATVMVVKNAERFGLAQLHQLRGRVGRSSDQGYCVLISSHVTSPRLKVMTQTTDGFRIAKADLDLRGSGNLVGTAQSGIDKAVELIAEKPEMYRRLKDILERH